MVCCCSLTFKYKLYCDANYYSFDCSVYCEANDTNAGGHYTCDPITGHIVCRPGMLMRVNGTLVGYLSYDYLEYYT